MNKKQFSAFLTLLMCADPWPISVGDEESTLKDFANEYSKKFGFKDWVDAYHGRGIDYNDLISSGKRAFYMGVKYTDNPVEIRTHRNGWHWWNEGWLGAQVIFKD